MGFDKDDEEIIKLASRIKDFRCEASRVNIFDDEDDGQLSQDELVYTVSVITIVTKKHVCFMPF